jgi:transcriptional regulator with XRE-family HTH domain
MTPEIFDGEVLRRYRERLGMTQAELAEAVGADPQTISRYERGELPIRWPRLWQLALEWLLTR